MIKLSLFCRHFVLVWGISFIASIQKPHCATIHIMTNAKQLITGCYLTWCLLLKYGSHSSHKITHKKTLDNKIHMRMGKEKHSWDNSTNRTKMGFDIDISEKGRKLSGYTFTLNFRWLDDGWWLMNELL